MIIDDARELRLRKFKRDLRIKTLEELEIMLPALEKILDTKSRLINHHSIIGRNKKGAILTYILTKHKLDAVKLEIKIRKENNPETKKQLKIKQRFSNDEEYLVND